MPLRHLLPSTFSPRAPFSSATYQSPTTASKDGEGPPTGSASKVTFASLLPAGSGDELALGDAGVACGPGPPPVDPWACSADPVAGAVAIGAAEPTVDDGGAGRSQAA